MRGGDHGGTPATMLGMLRALFLLVGGTNGLDLQDRTPLHALQQYCWERFERDVGQDRALWTHERLDDALRYHRLLHLLLHAEHHLTPPLCEHLSELALSLLTDLEAALVPPPP